MSEERGDTIDLADIGRALQRLTTEVASLRDDMKMLTAIVLRHETMLLRLDETINAMLQQITAMVAQNQRTTDRLRVLEDHITAE
jgi:septal ring factor EnvC (AmiA/AmiB activator)